MWKGQQELCVLSFLKPIRSCPQCRGFGAGNPPSSPLDSGKEHLSLGRAEGPFSMGALGASWKKQKPEEAAGGNLEDVFCNLLGWMGGHGLDPPSTGRRGADPTKETPKSSHSTGSARSSTPWGGTQDCLVLNMDAGGIFPAAAVPGLSGAPGGEEPSRRKIKESDTECQAPPVLSWYYNLKPAKLYLT